MRYWLLLSATFLKRYKVQILAGLAVGVLVFISTPFLLAHLPNFRTTQNIGMVGRYSVTELPLSIQDKLSIGLTTLDTAGQPGPGLAKSWQASDSGKVYTFHLDTSIKWQDGKNLVNRDINYQFRDTAIEYTGTDIITIRLKDPFAPLPTVVSRPVFKTGLLGVGSYKASKIKRNGGLIDVLTLTPADTHSALPNLAYHFYASEQQARTAYKLGEVQSIEDVQEPGELATWPNTRLSQTAHDDRYVAVFFNMDNPFFKGTGSGKNLRQALAYAIDKTRYANRSVGPLNPNSWAYFEDVKKYDLDIAKSRQLLAKVEKIPDEITISTAQAYLGIADNIKKDWEAVGIKSKVVVAPNLTGDFEVLLIAQAIPTDPDQYNQWHSTQDTNLTNLDDPRIDKLLEDGRKVLDPAARKVIYTDFQRFLVEDTPVIFLFHPTSYTIIKK